MPMTITLSLIVLFVASCCGLLISAIRRQQDRPVPQIKEGRPEILPYYDAFTDRQADRRPVGQGGHRAA